ncbi:MAG: phage tail tape measure protein [Paracoccaceae bacterium]
MSDIPEFEAQIASLEVSLGGAAGMVAAFEGELARMEQSLVFTTREVGALTSGFSSGLRRAFDGVILDGKRLSDALGEVAQSMIDTVYDVAISPVQNAVGGALAQGLNGLLSGMMPFADGAAFSQGRVTAFAKGGIVSSATTFPMRGGTGLMGEAGAEAIMPLARGPDGRLGVQTQGSGSRAVNVVMNISTPDVAGFQRSQSQIAAQAMRALARGQRNR